jgi:hypothetical protein
VLGIAPLRLVEDPLDHLGRALTTLAVSHLFLATGPGAGSCPSGVRQGEDVRRGARRRLGVVDRADLRHPPAILLLDAGEIARSLMPTSASRTTAWPRSTCARAGRRSTRSAT